VGCPILYGRAARRPSIAWSAHRLAPITAPDFGVWPVHALVEQLAGLADPAAARDEHQFVVARLSASRARAHEEVDLFTEPIGHGDALRKRNIILQCNKIAKVIFRIDYAIRSGSMSRARLPVSVAASASRLRLEPIRLGVVLGRHREQRFAGAAMETAARQRPADQRLAAMIEYVPDFRVPPRQWSRMEVPARS